MRYSDQSYLILFFRRDWPKTRMIQSIGLITAHSIYFVVIIQRLLNVSENRYQQINLFWKGKTINMDSSEPLDNLYILKLCFRLLMFGILSAMQGRRDEAEAVFERATTISGYALNFWAYAFSWDIYFQTKPFSVVVRDCQNFTSMWHGLYAIRDLF